MKIIRLGLYLIGLLLALAVVGAVVFALTFDPNQLKGPLERLVYERTGRTLTIKGDLTLAIFPHLGARVGAAILSEKNRPEPFVTVESVNLSLAPLPLFSGNAVINGFEVKGLTLRLIRSTQGQLNVGDLLGTPSEVTASTQAGHTSSAKTPLQFDVNQIRLDEGTISYHDQLTGQRLNLGNLRMGTGRVAPGASGDLTLSGVLESPMNNARLAVSARTTYAIDRDLNRVTLRGLQAEGKGQLSKLTNVMLDLRAAADMDWTVPGLKVEQPILKATANSPQGAIALSVSSLDVQKTPDRWIVRDAEVSSLLRAEAGTVDSRWQTARLEVTGDAMHSPRLQTHTRFSRSGDAAPPLTLDLAGPSTVNIAKSVVSAQLSGDLDGSRVALSIEGNWAKKTWLEFDVQTGVLDLDRFVAASPPKTRAAANHQQQPGTDPPLDLAALDSLNASGRLRVDGIKSNQVALRQIDATVKLLDGKLAIKPFYAEIFDGHTRGSLTVEANQQRFRLQQTVSDVRLEAVTQAFTGKPTISGRGDASIDLTASGLSVAALKQSLTGHASARAMQGAIHGIDLVAVMSGVQQALKDNKPTSEATGIGRTEFAEISGSAVLNQGVATNKDLLMNSSMFRVQGSGTINVPQSSLNYDLQLVLLDLPRSWISGDILSLLGLTVPIQVSGPFDNLDYKVDTVGLAAGLARNRATNIITKPLEQLLPNIRDGLKSLFGR